MRSFMTRLQRRVAEEQSGFTLIELLIVLVIIGILLAIAVPSYLGFKDRANNTAAEANVRAGVPAVEAYYASNGTYVGLSLAALQAIDSGVKLNDPAASAAKQTLTSYCISATVGGKTWYRGGPGATITTTAC